MFEAFFAFELDRIKRKQVKRNGQLKLKLKYFLKTGATFQKLVFKILQRLRFSKTEYELRLIQKNSNCIRPHFFFNLQTVQKRVFVS